MKPKPSSHSSHSPSERAGSIESIFGQDVFSIRVMRDYLSPKTYKSLMATICEGRSLEAGIAEEVADAMRRWAIAKGATHFTHWFQPLTGTTAEKHDSFIMPDREGGVLLRFSARELIQGEPDASSFPSGGLRATFEARGYTAWDPTSPAFVKHGRNGAVLCIPTVFCGYHGESLDKKTPLLRSLDALSKQVCRLGALFGVKAAHPRAFVDLGIEQEYFLIDRRFYNRRLDLLQAGRTLFGRTPAKHQQMSDHYFGAINRRVLAFMEDLDRALWRLGIPARTRHNEVSPGQYEIAPVFEEANLAVDHNMITMEVLADTAEQHGFACLLHEKPFKGVNGSGKHMNWNVRGPDGKNWLKPGDSPHEDAKFITMLCAVMKAVDTHADILRAAVASAGNDHRLGAHEAPPAIMSIFLGEQLAEIIDQVGQGGARSSRGNSILHIGISSLPPLPRDATDRNRTSPFAFTGTKFEFRAVGADQSCADPCMVLNTIVAESLDHMCTRLEADVAAGKDFHKSLQALLQDIVRKHRRVIFNGDNYTDDWKKEAAKRGLPNVQKTPDALKAMLDEKNLALFETYKVLSRRELESRYEVYRKEYEIITRIEAEGGAYMTRTFVVPAAMRYENQLAATVNAVQNAKVGDVARQSGLLAQVRGLTERLLENVDSLDTAVAKGTGPDMIRDLGEVRKTADELEGLIPDDLRPLPSYTEMMFTI